MRDGEGPRICRRSREVGRGLEAAEEVRLLEDGARRVFRCLAELVGSVVPSVWVTSTTSRPKPGA